MKKKLNFGKAIRIIRAEYDLNRKQLSEKAGISYPYLTDIESGTKRPSADILTKIADALSISTSELLARIEEISEKGSVLKEPLSDFDKIKEEFKSEEEQAKNKNALIRDITKELEKSKIDDLNMLSKIVKRLVYSTKNKIK